MDGLGAFAAFDEFEFYFEFARGFALRIFD
jgi:hypothetical protein